MKIRATKGTKLEKLIIKMNDQLIQDEKEAKEMAKEYCGIMPDAVGYIWVFGITAEFDCFLIGFKDVEAKPNRLILNKKYKDGHTWQPNRRTKEGKEFISNWNKKFHGIDGVPLSKFGIPVMDEKTGIYCHWLPLKDENGYYISVGSSLIDRMASTKSDQFTIEV